MSEKKTQKEEKIWWGDWDRHLFNEGTHTRLHDRMGAHRVSENGRDGTRFSVWAPNASAVSVLGEWNGWRHGATELAPVGTSGVWSGFVAGAGNGTLYKYAILTRSGQILEKADPMAFATEQPPRTASRVWDLDYAWGDHSWMSERRARNAHSAPISIYEIHLGSWRRVPEDNDRWLTYREAAPQLVDHVRRMGFTHVEFLPLMEHPFYGSWGYQTTSYYAPTSRYGTPQDLMYLIDVLHQNGIGVILDWVPSHFPTDGHGLAWFDGTHLYEHEDPRQGFHPDWKSAIFNYGRNEVRSFLTSSALFWMEKYHVDGIRVDAVASMLYLDYSRQGGEWVANPHGGRENLDAISFLRQLNTEIYRSFPDAQTYAEESTAWPKVSRPVDAGGLGFGFKWDMGWMHDILRYMSKDPIHRRFHHNDLTFRLLYAFNENFVLSLSHDEVVHGKGSLLGKMSGQGLERFAHLRLLFGLMAGQPGKKLLFMGSEWGSWKEWNHEASLDWHLRDHGPHAGVEKWVADVNRFVREEPALHGLDFDPAGFEWIDCDDAESSVVSWIRRSGDDVVLVVANATPVARENYRVGVPRGGFWREALNSDAVNYNGSGVGNCGGFQADSVPWHGRSHSLNLRLPPSGILFFKSAGSGTPA